MGHETNGNGRVRVYCMVVMWRRWPKVVVAVRDEGLGNKALYRYVMIYQQQMHPSIGQVNLSE